MVLTKTSDIINEIYRYREVLYSLVSQDLKIRYKRTYFGYFWSLLNPILQLAVLSAVFSLVMRIGIENYAFFLFSGNIAWSFILVGLIVGSGSMVENEGFIKKIHIPKLIFPLSKVLMRLVDFAFALVALGILMVLLGYPCHWTIVLLPFATIILFAFVLGCSMILSVATVYLRDIEYLLGVFLQLMFFATPIIYPITIVPEKYRIYLTLNPFFHIIYIFQQLIYYGKVPSAMEWGVAIGLAFAVLVVGFKVMAVFDKKLVYRL